MTFESQILSVDSIREFFEETLREVLDRQKTLTPELATAGYLVDLLCQYAFRPPTFEQPMSAIISESGNLAGRRIPKLKKVGDHSLYMAGYFAPALGVRGKLDFEYYNTMGGTAYRRLSRLLQRRGNAKTLSQVYAELGGQFDRFAEVLTGVRAVTESANSSIVDLCEEWLRTGRKELQRNLRAALVTIPGDSAKN